MKRNIITLTVLASLTLGGSVFANEATATVTNVEAVPISAEVDGNVETDLISSVDSSVVYEGYGFSFVLPNQYVEDVVLISTMSEPPMVNVIVVEGDVSTPIGSVKIEKTEEGYEQSFISIRESGEEVELTEKAEEILTYVEENLEEVIVTGEVEEVTEVAEFVNVFNGSGYMIQMPKQLEGEVVVKTTKSNPPQLIFGLQEGETVNPLFALEIAKGEYTGKGEVVTSGNGYTFAVKFVEEEGSERFEEVQAYFEANMAGLIAFASDYNAGTTNIIVNNTKVGELKQVGEGEYMLPLRAVCEGLGLDVIWDNTNKAIAVTNGKFVSELRIGQEEYTVNKSVARFETAPVAIDGVTYVPVSFVKDGLGLETIMSEGVLIIK